VIQRRWWPDPIQDVNDPNLSCNRGYDPTIPRVSMPLHAPIFAGQNISVTWDQQVPCKSDFNMTYDNQSYSPCDYYRTTWVHDLGPILVYMADCHGSCSDVDTSKLEWFKIQEQSYLLNYDPLDEPVQGYPSKDWYQYNATKGFGWSVQVPKNLKPGKYMLRHEIIMIELMPPQFYPDCAQLEVLGHGTEVPTKDYLVEFPGAYSMNGK
jgi:hypothetical protein